MSTSNFSTKGPKDVPPKMILGAIYDNQQYTDRHHNSYNNIA